MSGGVDKSGGCACQPPFSTPVPDETPQALHGPVKRFVAKLDDIGGQQIVDIIVLCGECF